MFEISSESGMKEEGTNQERDLGNKDTQFLHLGFPPSTFTLRTCGRNDEWGAKWSTYAQREFRRGWRDIKAASRKPSDGM